MWPLRWRRMVSDTAAAPGSRPDDRPTDLAGDGRGAVREAARADERPAGSQRGCDQGGVAGVHNDVRVGDAVPGHASRRTAVRLDIWLDDARRPGIYGMRCFARTLRQDIETVCNALLERGSDGQTEGQINRLKRLKRAMYGRAGVELLRARIMSLQP